MITDIAVASNQTQLGTETHLDKI
uniref:Transposase n=1 Tax=Heterorhabditis bacteriophora TaxID=37862 RepID=A0A1I7X209_HETBA